MREQAQDSAFERGYKAGYRAALGAAAAECRRQSEALDYSGNTYVRYGDATRCAAAVSRLRVPAITDEPSRVSDEDIEWAKAGIELLVDEGWETSAAALRRILACVQGGDA